ncbi:FecR family protein [Pedobacter nutrimenti]|uniref:FecR family protein n=1 Tax=Pedobacter nutrimenti TaxID=1241337 RepID=UPI00292DDD3E|nr:FecR family protein [Pedobacter nutrimenti]
MSRASFHQLLEKYQQGNCSPEEQRLVEQWYEMLDAEEIPDHPDEFNNLEQKLWDKIKGDIQEKPPVQKFRKNYVFHFLQPAFTIAAAFGAVLLISTAFYFYQDYTKPSKQLFSKVKSLLIKANSTETDLKIDLEDGSTIFLGPHSNVQYPEHFSAAVREVELTGNAFFQVSKNPSRPFLVYNKNTITRVVGTSFTIRTNASNNETEVTVKTGKVIVTAKEEKRAFSLRKLFQTTPEVVLVPNQKTIFLPDAGHFTTTLADNPIPVQVKDQPKNADYKFNETPVSEVLSQLETTYGIKIFIQDEALKNNTFTGNLSEQNLYNKIDFLCQSINASYQLSGTTIVIKSRNKIN